MLKVIDWSHARIQGEGGRESGPPPPEKIGFPSIIDPDPIKSQSYQLHACIQYSAIIKMAFHWWTDDDPL